MAPTLVALACVAGLLKAGHKLGWLLAAPVALDPEVTVLVHQSLASRAAPPAEIVLVGDSTCLTGVDAQELSNQLPGRPRVLSLALFIWLDLEVYGEAVADFASAHPVQVRTVVLLVTPAKLGGMGESYGGRTMWQEVHQARRPSELPDQPGGERDWLGAQLLRRRILSHGLATPQHGTGASFFGFSSEIDAYMTEH